MYDKHLWDAPRANTEQRFCFRVFALVGASKPLTRRALRAERIWAPVIMAICQPPISQGLFLTNVLFPDILPEIEALYDQTAASGPQPFSQAAQAAKNHAP